MQQFLSLIPVTLRKYLETIPSEWLWTAFHALFAIFMLLCLWATYYCFRRALGHEKFKGNWYNPENLQKLKQELYSGVRDGRLPDSETMAFLDKHIYGKESELRKMSGNGWI